MLKRVGRTFVGAVLGMFALSAQAGLLGATVDVRFYFPNSTTVLCDNGNAVVGAGVEYPTGCDGFGAVSIDISDSGFTVDTGGAPWTAASFNGIVIDVITGPDFASVTYAGGSMGVTAVSAISGDASVNFAGQSGGTANFTFTTGAAVPEPATLTLLGIGLAGIGFSRRRQ